MSDDKDRVVIMPFTSESILTMAGMIFGEDLVPLDSKVVRLFYNQETATVRLMVRSSTFEASRLTEVPILTLAASSDRLKRVMHAIRLVELGEM